MILRDDGFFRELSDNRICTITGRLGSGKTLIALELARYYLDKGYSLITNTTTVWGDNPDTVIKRSVQRANLRQEELKQNGNIHTKIAPQVKAVSIVDEGGVHARSAKIAASIATFARKTDQIIIFAGKKQPHADLSDLKVVMWFDFHKNFLLPFKVWEWTYRLSPRKIYGGKIVQMYWQDYWGTYSTIDPAGDAEQIVNFSIRAAQNIYKKFGRKYTLSDVEKGKPNERAEDAMEVLSETLAHAADASLSSLQGRGGRRRK